MNAYLRFPLLKWPILFLGILFSCFHFSSIAKSLQLVSATGPDFGAPSVGGGDSYVPVLSRDGRFVLFGSTANNLVSLGTNHPLPVVVPAPINVFLRDRVRGSTVLVSINQFGTGGGNADSMPIAISTNGQYALFESIASDLVAGDTNNASDIFVRDLLANTTVLVSTGTNGGCANNGSYSSTMTPDGRFVAFASAADDLVSGDTNGIPDVFVRDLVNHVTTVASVGAQAPAGVYTDVGSVAPLLTPDARYVAFYSAATNLVPEVHTLGNLYLRDRLSGTTTWVSAGAVNALRSLGTVSNAISFNHVLSDDGRFIAFEALAYPETSPSVILRYETQTGQTQMIETNAAVPPGGTYEGIQDLAMTPDGRFVAYVANESMTSLTTTEVRVWDEQSGTSILVSGNLDHSVTSGTVSDSPTLSENGQVVAFVSGASDLVTNALEGDFHMYLRDLLSGTTILVDADTNGAGSLIDPASAPAMSADGRFLAFAAEDGNLVPADRNHAYDVFGRSLTNLNVELISVRDSVLPSLTPAGPSSLSSFGISSTGRFVAFWSDADDLVAKDTNGVRDVFLRDLAASTQLVSVATNGFAADGYSTDASISADGRYVAFTSAGDDLVAGDNNRAQDVFVRDMQAGVTVLASINTTGSGPGNSDSYSPILSADGQSVLFRSRAGNLASGMIAGTENLFWRDLRINRTYPLTTNGTTAASMTPDGGLVAYITSSSKVLPNSDRLNVWNSHSNAIIDSLVSIGFSSIAISSDGRRLAYATNNSGAKQLQVWDRAFGTNWFVASYRSSSAAPPHFDGGGQFLAYSGTMGTISGATQVYLLDLQTGTNLLVSRSYDGDSPGDGDSDSIDLSSDARFVTYRSAAANLVPGDTNGLPDIFLFDRANGVTTLVSASRFGTGSADNRSLLPSFSGDGRTLAFVSWASDLLPSDFNRNADIFALRLETDGALPSLTIRVLPTSTSSPFTWLTWPVVNGQSYRVQFKDQLSDARWQELVGNISILGDQGYLRLDRAVSTRFYRVVAF